MEIAINISMFSLGLLAGWAVTGLVFNPLLREALGYTPKRRRAIPKGTGGPKALRKPGKPPKTPPPPPGPALPMDEAPGSVPFSDEGQGRS